VNICQPIRSVLGSVVSVEATSVTTDPAGCVSKLAHLLSILYIAKENFSARMGVDDGLDDMANFLALLKFTITPIRSALRGILWALLITASKQAPPSWQQTLFAQLKGHSCLLKLGELTRGMGANEKFDKFYH
jgi:hypothetical protein